MKRVIIQIIGLIIFGSSLFAQENKFDLGIYATPTIAQMYGDGMFKDSKFKYGYMFGLSARYNYNKIFSIGTELLYENKGATDKIIYTNEFAQPIAEPAMYYNFNYLIIPILFQFKTNNKIKLFYNLGPYYGILLDAKVKTDAAAGWSEHQSVITALFNKNDFGLCGGIGAEYHFKTKFIVSIELRDNLGIMKLSSGNNNEEYAIRTNSFNLIFGFKYKLF